MRKQAITIKNDFTTALVKALTRFEPSLLKMVLPAEASKAKKANIIYSTLDSILQFNKKKKTHNVSQFQLSYFY